MPELGLQGLLAGRGFFTAVEVLAHPSRYPDPLATLRGRFPGETQSTLEALLATARTGMEGGRQYQAGSGRYVLTPEQLPAIGALLDNQYRAAIRVRFRDANTQRDEFRWVVWEGFGAPTPELLQQFAEDSIAGNRDYERFNLADATFEVVYIIRGPESGS